MPLPISIENFGLQRREEGFSTSLDNFEFLVPFSGPNTATEWQFRRIVEPQLPAALQNLQKYAYSSDKKAYVVFEALLEVGDGMRITEMRLWQMIVDNWTASGNPQDSLRYVGFASIVNETVALLIEDEFQATQGQGEFGTDVQRMLTITPEIGRTWERNPFIRMGVRIATSLSTPHKTVMCVKAHLIKRHEVGIYMVLELKNGEPGQENYREELLRKVEPMVAYNLEQKQAARAAGKEWEEVVFLLPENTDPRQMVSQ
ncbi:hypothetical protein N0V93_004642 [Gnomoniopsis smithogilvyi]|uniref:Uncharacterized protein n=1 Tax=Gnomoniopsis smithogilvyi TaxID=1191159 RepID=A0A9W8YRU9_9PEZI|nr:hypothetical protein N0V93_004642 [Gnomoniopsis smithogilvyi]